MYFTRHFGRIVRERRERRGMTIFQLAEKCDMSERGLELIELGDSDPKLSNALNIAKVLELDIGELNICLPNG